MPAQAQKTARDLEPVRARDLALGLALGQEPGRGSERVMGPEMAQERGLVRARAQETARGKGRDWAQGLVPQRGRHSEPR